MKLINVELLPDMIIMIMIMNYFGKLLCQVVLVAQQFLVDALPDESARARFFARRAAIRSRLSV